MRRILAGMAVAAFMLTAGAAAAKDLPEGGLTAQEVASWLQKNGYRGDISTTSEGRPKVASATQGINFFIHFFDCKGDRCASIQFSAGFTTDGAYTLEKANQWNNEKRWITATMDDEHDPWISRDIDLYPGGTYEMLDDELKIWDDMVGHFLKTIDFK